MQCLACGATNPDTAAWCGQCLVRFDAPAATSVPTPGARPAGAAATAAPGTTPQPTSSESFRRVGDQLQWACPQCSQFNGIDEPVCAVCGTPFVERFRAAEAPEPPRNWSQALLFSAVAPGAGHLAVGRYGSGWARLMLFVSWIIGALLMSSSGGARAGAPLLLGAAVMWGGSLVDLRRLQEGQDELLVGRRLLWLVLGVLLLLGITMVSSALQILR